MRFLFQLHSVLSLSWRLFALTVGAKYRKSFLGYFWMVAPALLITAGVTLANRAGIINPGATVLPYPLFVLVGTLMWQVFVESFEVPHQAFEGARSYLTRVNFQREAIILAQLYEALVTAGVRFLVVVVAVTALYGPSLGAIAWVAVCFVGVVLLGLGIGALLMPFTLLFSDLQNTIKLVLSYGLFLTPAMYQPQSGSLFDALIRWNPISPLMTSAREAAAELAFTHPQALGVVLVASVLATLMGVVFIRATAPIVIERMLLGGR